MDTSKLKANASQVHARDLYSARRRQAAAAVAESEPSNNNNTLWAPLMGISPSPSTTAARPLPYVTLTPFRKELLKVLTPGAMQIEFVHRLHEQDDRDKDAVLVSHLMSLASQGDVNTQQNVPAEASTASAAIAQAMKKRTNDGKPLGSSPKRNPEFSLLNQKQNYKDNEDEDDRPLSRLEVLASARNGRSGRAAPLSPCEYRSLLSSHSKNNPPYHHPTKIIPTTVMENHSRDHSNSASQRKSSISFMFDDQMPSPIVGTELFNSSSRHRHLYNTPLNIHKQRSSKITPGDAVTSYRDSAFINSRKPLKVPSHQDANFNGESSFTFPEALRGTNAANNCLTYNTLSQLSYSSDDEAHRMPKRPVPVVDSEEHSDGHEVTEGLTQTNPWYAISSPPTIYQQFTATASNPTGTMATASRSTTSNSFATAFTLYDPKMAPEASFGGLSTMVSADFGPSAPSSGPSKVQEAFSESPKAPIGPTEAQPKLSSTAFGDKASHLQIVDDMDMMKEADHETIASAAKQLLAELGNRATSDQKAVLATVIGRHTSRARKLSRKITVNGTLQDEQWSVQSEGTLLSEGQLAETSEDKHYVNLSQEAALAMLRRVLVQNGRAIGNAALHSQKERLRAGARLIDTSSHDALPEPKNSFVDPTVKPLFRLSVPKSSPRRVTKGEAILQYHNDKVGSYRRQLDDRVHQQCEKDKQLLKAELNVSCPQPAQTHRSRAASQPTSQQKRQSQSTRYSNVDDGRHAYICVSHPAMLPRHVASSSWSHQPMKGYRLAETFQVPQQ